MCSCIPATDCVTNSQSPNYICVYILTYHPVVPWEMQFMVVVKGVDVNWGHKSEYWIYWYGWCIQWSTRGIVIMISVKVSTACMCAHCAWMLYKNSWVLFSYSRTDSADFWVSFTSNYITTAVKIYIFVEYICMYCNVYCVVCVCVHTCVHVWVGGCLCV